MTSKTSGAFNLGGTNQSGFVVVFFLVLPPSLSHLADSRFSSSRTPVKSLKPSETLVSSILQHRRTLILESESLEPTRELLTIWSSRMSSRLMGGLSTREMILTGLLLIFTSESSFFSTRVARILGLTRASTFIFPSAGRRVSLELATFRSSRPS